jgi:cell division protein FtsB
MSKETASSTGLPSVETLVKYFHLAAPDQYGTKLAFESTLSKSKERADANSEVTTLPTVPSIFDCKEQYLNKNDKMIATRYFIGSFHKTVKDYAARVLALYTNPKEHFKALNEIPLDLIAFFWDFQTKVLFFAVPFYAFKIALGKDTAHGLTIIEKPKQIPVTLFKALPLKTSLMLARRIYFPDALPNPTVAGERAFLQALVDKLLNDDGIVELNGYHGAVLPSWFYYQSVPVVTEILKSRQQSRRSKTPSCSSKLQDDDDGEGTDVDEDGDEDNPLTTLHDDDDAAYSTSLLKVTPTEAKKGTPVEPTPKNAATPAGKRARVEEVEPVVSSKGKGKGKAKPKAAGEVNIMIPDDAFDKPNVLKWLGDNYLAGTTPVDYVPDKSIPASFKAKPLNEVIKALLPNHDKNKGLRIHEYAILLVLFGFSDEKTMDSYLSRIPDQISNPATDYGKMLFGAYPPGVTPDEFKIPLKSIDEDDPTYIENGKLKLAREREYNATIRVASGAVMSVLGCLDNFMDEKVKPVAQQRTLLFDKVQELEAINKRAEAEVSALKSDLAKSESDLKAKAAQCTQLEEQIAELEAQVKTLKAKTAVAKKPAIDPADF